MFELLFIVAVVAWGAIACLEYLASLPAAPTLALAVLALPFLAVWRVRRLMRQTGLEFLRTGRRPLPPERFYWPSARKMLGRRVIRCAAVAMAAWPAALIWPARLSLDPVAMAGWLAAFMAIGSLCEALAALWLYARASQRCHPLAPAAIGWVRRGLYLLSDNHEFLGEEPLPKKQQARESVY